MGRKAVNCEGNCGTALADCDGYYTVMGPWPHEELNFCSLACMDSWLSMTRSLT